jgi:hypothetical protein
VTRHCPAPSGPIPLFIASSGDPWAVGVRGCLGEGGKTRLSGWRPRGFPAESGYCPLSFSRWATRSRAGSNGRLFWERRGALIQSGAPAHSEPLPRPTRAPSDVAPSAVVDPLQIPNEFPHHSRRCETRRGKTAVDSNRVAVARHFGIPTNSLDRPGHTHSNTRGWSSPLLGFTKLKAGKRTARCWATPAPGLRTEFKVDSVKEGVMSFSLPRVPTWCLSMNLPSPGVRPPSLCVAGRRQGAGLVLAGSWSVSAAPAPSELSSIPQPQNAH